MLINWSRVKRAAQSVFCVLFVGAILLLGSGENCLQQSCWADEHSNSHDNEIIDVLVKNQPTVVVTDNFERFSLDPLHGAATRNIRIMNLLYEKPLKTDKNGFLVSDILESFSFDSKTNELSFSVKKGLKYSDGTVITVEDVVMAIKRAAYFRPSYPGLDKIVGLKTWVERQSSFGSTPAGLNILDANSAVIKFSEKIRNPLDTLSNDVFFVIPSRCIDKENGKLVCVRPPYSGKYSLATSNKNLISFSLWRDSKKKFPEHINLIFIPAIRLIKFLPYYKTNHVMIVEQIYIPPDHMKIMERKIKLNSIPEYRFMAINLNSKAPPFDNIRVRQYFVREYRRTLKEHFGQADGSMFTRIMPGYVSLDELNRDIPQFTEKEEDEILSLLKKMPPNYNTTSTDIGLEPFKYYFDITMKRLGIANPPPTPLKSIPEYLNFWRQGKIHIGWFYYGFSSIDPTEALLIMFPKNMFNISNDLSRDPRIQQFIAKINHRNLSEIDVENLKSFSRYLFNESVFSVVANYSYIQFTVKESNLKIVNDWTEDVSNFFTK